MDVKEESEHMYEKKKGQAYYTNRHSCFLLQYHMVLVTKYRHPVLTGGVKEIVYGTIRDIFLEKGLVILEMNGEADHVHVLFEADPFTAPGTLVNIVKTKTSRFARKEYGESVLKKYYWKPYFWSDSCFVTRSARILSQWSGITSGTNKLVLAFTHNHSVQQLLWMWYSATSLHRKGSTPSRM